MAPFGRHSALEDSKLTATKRIPYTYDKIMKAYHEKHASIHFRNNLLKSQARANYHNEYDRISGILNDTVLGHGDKQRLLDRKQELQGLFSKSHTTDYNNLSKH